MAYCIKCGKEIQDGIKYCEEHSPENSNSQQIMPNVSFVAGEKQKDVDFTVDANGTVAAQFGGAPVQNDVIAPVKKTPLWILPVGALVAIICSNIFSTIGSSILNLFVYNITFLDTDFLRFIFNGNIIPTLLFVVLSFGSLILYNKNCKKNGLEDAEFPIFYGGIFYVCRVVGSVVGNLLASLVWLILSIVGEFTWLPFEAYEAYNVIYGIAGLINAVIFVVATFFVFSFIQKKQAKK